jgi:uncharacterized protein YmfQ (DUF2313 family)
MPRGRVWPRDPDAVQTRVLIGTCSELCARDGACELSCSSTRFPATTYELLPEWESTLGLPDPCAGVAPTIPQRQAQVLARFVGVGGPTISSLTSFAANLGYTVTINQFVEARAGQMRAGDACNGTAWSFAWQVNAPLNTVTIALAGSMAAGDPLASWGNAVLECEMKAVMPAHTIPIFSYS